MKIIKNKNYFIDDNCNQLYETVEKMNNDVDLVDGDIVYEVKIIKKLKVQNSGIKVEEIK